MRLIRPFSWSFFMITILLMTAFQAHATTTITNGIITQNTTWGPGASSSGDPAFVDDNELIIAVSEVRVGFTGGVTLTILPGTTLRFQDGAILRIGPFSAAPGTLVANGTADEPITFTTNNASPAPGLWQGIELTAYSGLGSSITYATIEYTGSSGHAAIQINKISATPGQPVISNNIIQHNSTYGIAMNGTTASNLVRPQITDNQFDNNAIGIYCYFAQPFIEYNDILNNTAGTAIQNDSNISGICVTAEYNWFGDTGGPNDVFGGTDACGFSTTNPSAGESVSAGVDYQPWLEQSINALRPPILLDPPDGEIIYTTQQPTLIVTNSPNSTPGTVYDFEVYENSISPANLVADVTDVAEGTTTTSWQVDVTLAENVTHVWRARARNTSETSDWSIDTFSFLIDLDDPPLNFSLLTPLDQATETVLRPTLTWESAENGDAGDEVRYNLVWDDNAGFTSPTTVSDLTATSYQFPTNLADNTIYYWNVEAFDTRGNSVQSDTWEFAVNQANNAPTAPTPNSPAESAVLDGLFVTLIVNNSSDVDPYSPALTYQFQLATAINFNPGDIEAQTTGVPEGSGTTSWDPPELQNESITYYWRARANDGTTTSGWSTIRSFISGEAPADPPPTAPGINSPADGATVYDQTPPLVVDIATDPEGQALTYEFQVSTSSNFASTVASVTNHPPDANGTTVTWNVPTTLNWGTTYYWRSRANDGTSSGPYATASFVMNSPPNAPTINSPTDGATGVSTSPTLIVNNASDPNGDTNLVYDFDIASDAAFTNIEASVTNVAQGASTTSWDSNASLSTLTTYYWRSRASDGFVEGGYVEGSFTTIDNQPPTAPTIASPADGATLYDQTPELSVNIASDDENDPLTYTFQLSSTPDFNPGDIIESINGVQASNGVATWQVTTTLDWATTYYWRAAANDGTSTGSYVTAMFMMNSGPDAPGISSPADGATGISSVQPLVLTVVNATDPEDDALTYAFDLATDDQFSNILDSVTGVAEGTGSTTSWTSAFDLQPTMTYYWRARATDGFVAGPYVEASFETADNEPPTTPTINSPANGATICDQTPLLRINRSTDPENDPITYEFDVASDDLFANIVASTTGETASGTTVSWTVPVALTWGETYYWRARANDGTSTSLYVQAEFTLNPIPGIPTINSPADGTVDVPLTPVPALRVNNASDPNGDNLTYSFDIADDVNYNNILASVSGLAQGGGGTTSWTPNISLTANTTYYWRARVNDGCNFGAYAEAAFSTITNLPPETFDLLSPADGAILSTARPTLDWEDANDPARNISFYDLQYATDPTFTQFEEISGITVSSYSFTFDLIENETYYWRVFAEDDFGERAQSNQTWSFAIDDVPEAPTAFDLVSPLNGVVVTSADLSWTASSDADPDDFVEYELTWADNINLNGSSSVDGLTATSYSLTNLTDNTDYFWAVVAYDTDGNTTNSTPAVGAFHLNMVNDPPNPPQSGFSPANGDVTDDTTPTISWDAATDPDIDDTPETLSYRLEVSDSPSFDFLFYAINTGAGVTSHTLATPLEDGLWYYRLRTTDDMGINSVYSATQSFIIQLCALPTAPTPISPVDESVADTTPDLTIENATDTNQPPLPLSYSFQVATSSTFGGTSIVAMGSGVSEGTGTTTWTVNNPLDDNTVFYWRSRADNGDCIGPWSTPATFCVDLTNDNPGVPSLISPQDGANATGSTQLNWSATTDPDCYDTVSYQVELSDSPDFPAPVLIHAATNTSVSIQNLNFYAQLEDDATYYWRVRSLDNRGGQSAASTGRSLCLNKTNDAPATVTTGFDPANDACMTDNTPQISWDAASDPDCGQGPATLRYEVQVSTSPEFTSITRTVTTQMGITTATISPALPDDQWYYRIRTRDQSSLESDWSATQSFIIDAQNADPSRPTLVSPPDGAVVNPTDLLTWTASNDPDMCDDLSYELQILDSADQVECEQVDIMATTFEVGDLDCYDSLEDNGSYQWQVQAVDSRGGSSGYTEPRGFILEKVQPPTTPAPFSPADEAIVDTATPQLCVQNSTDPNGLSLTYEFQVSLSPGFTTIAFEIDNVTQGTPRTCVTVSPALLENETYYWRARSFNGEASSSWSTTRSFCVDATNDAPTMPLNLNPGGVEATPDDDLCWTASTDPDCDGDLITYRLQIDDQSSFGSPAVNQPNLTTTCVSLGNYTAQLTDDLTYYWRVIASDGEGGQTTSQTAQFCYNEGNTAPNAVTSGFDPANDEEITDATPTITWDAASDPDCSDNAQHLRYRVEWGSNGTTFPNFGETNFGQTNFTIPQPLAENSHTFYRIRTSDHEGGISGYSAVQSFWLNATNEAPSAPENLQPAAGADLRVQDWLTWTAAVDPDPNAARDVITYTLQVAEDNGFNTIVSNNEGIPEPAFLAGDLANFDDLEDAQLYYWRVIATDDDGLSETSAGASFTLRKETPPDVPEVICPTNGTEILPTDVLCWTEPFDPDPDDVLIYHVQFSLNSNFSPIVVTVTDIPDTFYVIGDAADVLADDQTYFWRVQAEDSFDLVSGYSDGSDWFRYNEQNDAPNPVTSGFTPANGVEVTATAQPVISWDATTDDDWSDPPASLRYRVELSDENVFTDPDFVLQTQPGVTSVQVPALLDENQQYFYRIFAEDNEGEPSDPSATQNFWINQNEEPPTAPTELTPNDCASEVDNNDLLCWTPSVDPDPYGGIDHYTVQIATEDGFTDILVDEDVTANCAAVSDLTELDENSTYYWRVQATDADDLISAFSGTACFTVNRQNDLPLPVLTGFSPTDGTVLQNPQVEFCWDDATDPDPSDPPETLHYRLVLDQGSDHREFVSEPGQTCLTVAFDADGADDGSWEWYLVTLDNSNAASEPSATQTFVLDALPTPPGAPDPISPCDDLITATNQPTLVTAAAFDPDSQDLDYHFQVATALSFAPSAIVAESSADQDTAWQVDVELADRCNPYFWRVRASDGVSDSPWSDACPFVINFVDEPPTEFALIAPENNAMLTTVAPLFDWTGSTDPDCEGDVTYALYVSPSPDFDDNLTVVGDIATSQYQAPDNFLDDNTTYYWKVAAIDADADSAWSAQVWHFATNIANDPPTVPEFLVWANDSLSWDVSTDPDPNDAVESYNLQISSDDTFDDNDLLIEDIEDNYIWIGEFINLLDDGGQYFWRVQAFDGDDTSDWSDTAEFDAVLPVELTAFEAIPQGNTVTLTWEISDGANLAGFHVWRRAENDADFVRLTGALLVAESTTFRFVDAAIAPETRYEYQLEDVSTNGESYLHDPIAVLSPNFPGQTVLQQNYPNPFSPRTDIRFGLPRQMQINLSIYDVAGRLVKEVANGEFTAGYHHVSWDGNNNRQERVSEGVYFYVLRTDDQRLVKRMVLVK